MTGGCQAAAAVNIITLETDYSILPLSHVTRDCGQNVWTLSKQPLKQLQTKLDQFRFLELPKGCYLLFDRVFDV